MTRGTITAALLATGLALGLPGTGWATHDPDITDAEFKCQQAQSKAAGKFVGAKAKCVSKCLANFWKDPMLTPESDCLPPYGGATAQCVNDTVLFKKGAENKYAASIKKACDPITKPGTECPSCFDALGGTAGCGDAGYAGFQVQNIENQVDSFVPGVGCERAGADKDEQKCQTNTAKALSKLVGSVNKCYDKCFKNAHKGIGSAAACYPPASEMLTVACIQKADTKAIASVDKLCSQKVPGISGANANPDCGGPDTYPNGTAWVSLVEGAISGNVPDNYCGSPSSAFLD